MCPYLLAGVEFGTVGRDVEQEYVLGDLHVLHGVEASIVDDHHLILTGLEPGEFHQVTVEDIFAHPVHLPDERAAVHGRVAAVQVGGLESVLIGDHRPDTLGRHTAAHMGHQPEAALILEVQVDRIVLSLILSQTSPDPVQRGREF